MNFWMHEWKLNRQAHSRTIQIIEVQCNLQKSIDGIKKKIANMTDFEKQQLVVRLSK